MSGFVHLHQHTQFSILDGAANIKKLIAKAKELNMNALAITDHGNMYGAVHFYQQAKEHGIKPIIGCEVYVAPVSRFEKKGKESRSGFHLILLAKNKIGYHNLAKLVSLGYKEGFYYTPRVDKELLKEYSEGLIASSACIGGEIPSTILSMGEEAGEEVLKEYLDIFGENLCLELQRHGLEEQDRVNPILIKLARKYNIRLLATNDVHFIEAADYEAHHILICLNTQRDYDSAEGMLYTGKEYFRSPDEMNELFADIPEAVSNTQALADSIEDYNIKRDILLPVFPLPEGFTNQDEYLAHITWLGAKKRYAEITDDLKERIEFELSVIKDMGFAGYFLIVQDYIAKAREMDVLVGPGRGSATGSAVAYCLQITNIDPIKYELLFERFLNPERKSMPDIDVDFDDDGREKVLDYVVNTYGEDKVAQIITFGTMAARSAIRDVARVLKLPLSEADRLAKLIPEELNITLPKAFSLVKELSHEKHNGAALVQKTLRFAEVLEGSTRHTGTHACGVIIGPQNLMEFIPLSIAKDAKLMVTQFEGSDVEYAGMLKMDFLGLTTLSIIKDTLINIKKDKGIDVVIDDIPLDDPITFELFQKGKTVGIFQFESEGMQMYLKDLIPTDIEDLIAMNALYRPGPIGMIPTYILRKHGKAKISYYHDMIEDILKKTYGVMTYQEQIMQISRKMAGFSGGKADDLRKAMGKKKRDVILKLRSEFIDGAIQNQVPKEKAEEIYDSMSKFGEYGFNRSHSAAYAILAYQTGYLKAHYTAEYMASVLTHNINDLKKITFYIDECKRMGISVLGPDINESEIKFTVNSKGAIRCGLGAIKNVGTNAAEDMIRERNEKGSFADIFDLTARANLRTVNKKNIESLAYAGAFDCFTDIHRAQYFYTPPEKPGDPNLIDKAINFGNRMKQSLTSSQTSLFGEDIMANVPKPEIPQCEPWGVTQILEKEKEYIGFYLTAHPLDEFEIELNHLCNTMIDVFKQDQRKFLDKTFVIAGMVTEAKIKQDKRGRDYGFLVLEDYTDNIKLMLFQDTFLKFKHYLIPGLKLYVKGTVRKRHDKDKNTDEINIEIIEITLLSGVREATLKSVTIQLELSTLRYNTTEELEKIIKGNKGRCTVKLKVLDRENNISLDMFSDKLKIDPTNDFFNSLRNLPYVSFKLN
jgi:DNA polymerase III subunit alpha